MMSRSLLVVLGLLVCVQAQNHRVIIEKEPRTVVVQQDALTIWIEAEDFQDYGGWLLDTQFMHLMGSSYLIAAGVGTPVADATTEFRVTEPGSYRLWVRSRNWIREFAPGKFEVIINGHSAGKIFGAAESDEWGWESAGPVELDTGMNRLAVRDLTGFYGRIDALVFSRNPDYVPSTALEKLKTERAGFSGISLDPVNRGAFDVVIVGGGAAGGPAALASARSGAKTVLIHNRPVLGGNASIELGVPVRGASQHHAYSRESGISEELERLRVAREYPQLSRPFAEAAAAETNLTVFLNTHVYNAIMDGSRIAGVKAVDTLTGEESLFYGHTFVDTTGDGWLGYYAGADYRVGREARSEYDESLAPETADNITMSGCLMGDMKLGYGYEQRDTPQTYTAPEWAHKMPADFETGRTIKHARGQWWLEYPNDIDDIWNAELARDELLRIVFGYWDYIKNDWSRKNISRKLELTYVPITNAKRETRRLMGDYVLTQHDAVSARRFPDTIGHAGWSLDVHHPAGVFSGKEGPFDFDVLVPQNNIPFRALYSRNIDNLLFAGRCMSVTHVALGTVRVEGTCAVTGQAAGTAAAMCSQRNIVPRDIYERCIGELQQNLLKADQYVPGVVNQDAGDLARNAVLSASSFSVEDLMDEAFCEVDMTRSSALSLPWYFFYETGTNGYIGTLYVYLISTLPRDVHLPLTIRGADSNEDEAIASRPALAKVGVAVPSLYKGYIAFPINKHIPTPYFSIEFDTVRGRGLAAPWAARGHLGARVLRVRDKEEIITGRPRINAYCEPPLVYPRNYTPANAINGISRIVDLESNMWKSDPEQPLPQHLELSWDRPQTFRTVHLTFDTNLDSWRRADIFEQEVVKDYEIQVFSAGEWKMLVAEQDNFQRFRVHHFEPVTADKLRVVVKGTGGDPSARIYEIRIYNDPVNIKELS
ncbi:MAG: FAD-dependent oxidoreductase [Kiritimatiellales bacterium]